MPVNRLPWSVLNISGAPKRVVQRTLAGKAGRQSRLAIFTASAAAIFGLEQF
jgi:hypothetical protein